MSADNPEQRDNTIPLSSKEIAEIDKLHLEIAEFKKPWYKKHLVLIPILTFVASIITLFITLLSIWINYNSAYYANIRQELNTRSASLELDMKKSEEENKKVKEESEKIKGENATAQTKLNSVNTELTSAKTNLSAAQMELDEVNKINERVSMQNAGLLKEKSKLKNDLMESQIEVGKTADATRKGTQREALSQILSMKDTIIYYKHHFYKLKDSLNKINK